MSEKKYIIDGKEVVAWITRGGKRVPIFDKEEKDNENLKLNEYPDEDRLYNEDGNYGFFEEQSDKWLRDSDYEAKQNAYDYVTRDFPELGEAMREEQFGQNYPPVAKLYRVGGVRSGIVSFFPSREQAESYAQRLGVDGVTVVRVRTNNIVPTFSGAAEIWATEDDFL